MFVMLPLLSAFIIVPDTNIRSFTGILQVICDFFNISSLSLLNTVALTLKWHKSYA